MYNIALIDDDQRILQIVPDDNLVNLRTGKGDGEKIVYTSWRRI